MEVERVKVKVKVDSGEQRLKELGYKQELKRDLSLLHNFALSFSIISILGGVTILYNTGLSYGGPASMTYGWLIVSCFTMFVAVSMAEICSAFPTTGGLYFWSYQLAGKEWGPFAAWMTGWFNMVAQWAGTASIDYSLAVLIQTIILLSTGGANGGGYMASKYEVLGIYGGILLLHAAMNSLPVSWLAYLGTFAAAWNIVGVFVLMFLIPLVSPTRASAKFVFQHFNKETSYQIHSSPYVFFLGLLMSQYTLAGYDAAAHMSEEAKYSDKSGPYTIISAVAISIVVGWGYLLGITFAVTDLNHVLDPANDANGYAIAQVFYDAFKNRFGDGTGGIFCLAVAALAIFFSGMGAITSTSRMTYGFSRDEAMPLSRLWHSVNRWDVPVNAVWLCATVSFIMALTSLGSLVAFQAMVSVATIAIYIAYAIPSLLRVTAARKSFCNIQ
ncbi:hypothetical protein GOP47_0001291 [Adiantum capillus-veneris]|uniref:Amino-acid permease BAT1 homolog n=1 Tax=Adiantum capillus-veneris TaxID=13818 RepID=A0A9D4ZMX1_ADICA|nr:hypothetical protein GOP47_0001291 [Adiantum capillus-veneris]